MPIATKNHSTIIEESHYNNDENNIVIERIDEKLFDEIKELMDKVKNYEEEEEKCKRKIERYNQAIESAEEMIMKAESKKAELIKRHEFLKNCLTQKEDKKRQALKYWEDYGIDVKQVSTDEDNFQQYEFIYSRLSNKGTDASGDDTGAAGQCSINLKFHDKQLEIVEPVPGCLSDDTLNELNSRLTNSCVHNESGAVDYRLAMIMIKKELVKSLSLLAKTCSHPPAETNSHTCT